MAARSKDGILENPITLSSDKRLRVMRLALPCSLALLSPVIEAVALDRAVQPFLEWALYVYCG